MRHAFDTDSTSTQPTRPDEAKASPEPRPRCVGRDCGFGRLAFAAIVAVMPVAMAVALLLQRGTLPVCGYSAVTALAGPADVAAIDMPRQARNSQHWTDTPRTVEELTELESRLRGAALRAVPPTVGLIVGRGTGSGVIVSPDGLILTAGHVSTEPGQFCAVILPNGTQLRGRTLGVIRNLDAGMVIVDDPDAPDTLPFAELGTSDNLEPGTWTIATGHPEGYEVDRPPVVRVGRINVVQDEFLQTDNTLVGGDSGGPLFDLDGRVIGIHSRIGDSTDKNVHVPIDRFAEHWSTLAAGRDEGGLMTPLLQRWQEARLADDGIRIDLDDEPVDAATPGVPVRSVVEGSPADEAGIRAGDRVVAIDGVAVRTRGDLLERRADVGNGDRLLYEIERVDGSTEEIRLVPVAAEGRRGVLGIQPFAAVGPGAIVGNVVPESPAAQAGIRPGDRILSIRGVRVFSWNQLIALLRHARGGDVVTVRVESENGGTRELEIELEAYADVYREGRR